MAFCNSCGAPLADGTKFCNKCGATATGTPATAAPTPVAAAAPPPAKGGSSALKIILIIVGVIVLIGILGMVTCGVLIHRIAKNAKVSQKGDSVKIETPFGNIDSDPQKVAEELGVEIYPGAEVQKNGTASVSFGSLHTVTAIFQSSDSVDKICDFYKEKFPGAAMNSVENGRCSIIAGDKTNQTTIAVEPSGDGSKLTIVKLEKKS